MREIASRVTASNVDLSNCDREQIQYSNAVQPHAALVTVSRELKILQASENVAELRGIGAADLVGRPVSTLFGAPDARIASSLDRLTAPAAPVLLFRAGFGQTERNVLGHRMDNVAVLELERDGLELGFSSENLYTRLNEGIGTLHTTTSLGSFLQRSVEVVAELTGYERVMAYRFQADGSGEVVAETVAPGLEPYLGLHYPASDIPQPARRLFSMTWLRHLPQVDYTPSPLTPALHPETGDLLDLSFAGSRSVSVMYSRYLLNMGVASTMVITLLKRGKLWGLISCMHHSAPRHIPHQARTATELLAHVISVLMAAKEDEEMAGYRARLHDSLHRLTDTLSRGGDLVETLAQGQSHLLSALDADGAAIVRGGKVYPAGNTPAPETIAAIACQLSELTGDGAWATDSLATHAAAAPDVTASAAGLLARRISRRYPDYLLFFRREYLRTVNWAGNPDKPVDVVEQDGQARLMPRGSFALWRSEVAGRSKPWLDCEIAFANELGEAVIEVFLHRARELADLNTELRQSNRELDSFAYAASHDLKEPLRGIHAYAQMVQRNAAGKLSAQENTHLESVIRLAGRMEALIEGLLEYSRVGHTALNLAVKDLDAVVAEVLDTLRPALERAKAEVKVAGPLPEALIDATLVRQLFQNLITNAIKYSDRDEPLIEIGWKDSRPPVYFVKDNGIGIAPEHHHKIFEVFRRLHKRDAYGGGTGAGLTIARRAVERHGGRIWVESEPGAGATFYFTLDSEEP